MASADPCPNGYERPTLMDTMTVLNEADTHLDAIMEFGCSFVVRVALRQEEKAFDMADVTRCNELDDESLFIVSGHVVVNAEMDLRLSEAVLGAFIKNGGHIFDGL